MNLPNALSWFRVGLVVILPPVFYFAPHPNLWCALIVWLAGVSDFFDGYLARRYGWTTDFGAFIDPVADKLVVLVALFMLSVHMQDVWISSMSLVILIREMVISALREWMATRGARDKVKVSLMGKWKTVFQLTGIWAVFLSLWQPVLYTPALAIMALATVMSVVSMLNYFSAIKD